MFSKTYAKKQLTETPINVKKQLTEIPIRYRKIISDVVDSSQSVFTKTQDGGIHFGITFSYNKLFPQYSQTPITAIFTHAKAISYKPKLDSNLLSKQNSSAEKYETLPTPQLGSITNQIRSAGVPDDSLAKYLAELKPINLSNYTIGFFAKTQIQQLSVEPQIKRELGISFDNELKPFVDCIVSKFLFEILNQYMNNASLVIFKQTKKTVELVELKKEDLNHIELFRIFEEIGELKSSLSEEEFLGLITTLRNSNTTDVADIGELEIFESPQV